MQSYLGKGGLSLYTPFIILDVSECEPKGVVKSLKEMKWDRADLSEFQLLQLKSNLNMLIKKSMSMLEVSEEVVNPLLLHKSLNLSK